MSSFRTRLDNAKRYVTKNRKATIGVAAGLVIGVVAFTAWKSSDGKTAPKQRPAAHASSSVKSGNKPTAKAAAKPDPLAKGIELYEKKKYSEAIDVFQPMVDANVEARFWLGKAHLAEGNDFRGCRQLRLYVEKAPKGRYAASAKKDLTKC